MLDNGETRPIRSPEVQIGTISGIIHAAQIDEHLEAQIRVIAQRFHHLQKIACANRCGEFTQLRTHADEFIGQHILQAKRRAFPVDRIVI